MTYNYTFQGWLGLAPDAIEGKMVWDKFEPKTWEEDDVDIKVTHCSVCGSDCHTLKSGWGETLYPCCVGHEIVGKAVRVGSNVKHIQIGDRVGVGAQARSCSRPECPDCSIGMENYCSYGRVDTFNSEYPNGIGRAYGGYADYNRTNAKFVFKIPEKLASEDAAPMMCGGITMYSPLKYNRCGPSTRVGIIGIGGLGHFGILFAKALGAGKIVGISRKSSKRDEAIALGADACIATDDDEDWIAKNTMSLDLIISTVSSPKMPLSDYFKLLSTHGTFIQVGAPDGGKLPEINAFDLINKSLKLGGSSVGSPSQITEMLQLAAEKNIKPRVEVRSMKDANETVCDMEAGKARYRYVLVNEKHLE